MIAVELDTDAREASGLLAAAGSGEAYWSVLDEQRVEDSIVLIGRSGTAPGGWHLERMTGRFRAPDLRTSDGEALARHDGFVYVVGSHFGSEDDGLQARRAFVARFREADVVERPGARVDLDVWRSPFALHRLINDALRERAIALFPISDDARRAFIEATRADGHDDVIAGDWPLNVEGAAFRSDGSLLVGLRAPVSAAGEPLVVELGGFAAAFPPGSELPPVTRIWILERVGSPTSPAGIRDLEVEPDGEALSVITGCMDRELLRRGDREQTPEFKHWTVSLPRGGAGGSLTPTLVQSFPAELQRLEGVARRPDGGYVYMTDDEDRITLLLAGSAVR